MSTRVMSACWPIQIDPVAKSVLISLADNANDEGYCWPSIATICERTCLARSTVTAAIQRLEAAGLLRAFRETGLHSEYEITVDDPPPARRVLRRGPDREPVGGRSAAGRDPTDSRSGGQPGPDREPVGGRPTDGRGSTGSRSGPDREPVTNRKEPSMNHQRTVTAHGSADGGSEKQGRGSHLTIEDLPPRWRDWTLEHASSLDPDEVWLEFRDYWRAVPGARGRKTDWLATWRNRCRELVRRRPGAFSRSPASARPPSDAELIGRRYSRANLTPTTPLEELEAPFTIDMPE